MTIQRPSSSISRRTTLAALAGGSLGLALAGQATAQTDPVDLTDHPLTGVWLAMANPPLPDSPQVAAPSYYGADGFVLLMFPLSQLGPNGVQFNSAYMGTWEPHDEQTGHFTATSMLSNGEGTYLGTVTIDGFPHVNDDGQTFIDDGSRVMVTIRDPAGAIVDAFPGAGRPPVTGVKLGGGGHGFPEGTPEATPPS
jgi:hypothetical protein